MNQKVLSGIYLRLQKAFGPQHWWPADSAFEVMVGAILTQNTNWTNVEKAISQLKHLRVLTPQGIKELSHQQISEAIKPSGYFNVKAKRLKHFVNFLFKEYQGDLARMRKENVTLLRSKLLTVNGIGPETADSMLLYALSKKVFVIDAYTKRFMTRHNWIKEDISYHDLQGIFHKYYPKQISQYNEYHALIVKLGKDFCKPKPRCEQCPLKSYYYSVLSRCSKCYRDFLPDEKNVKKLSHETKQVICLPCHHAS